LWLWNLNDKSALLSPSFAYSAGDDVSLTGGLFFGLGDGALTPTQPVPSEFGLASNTGFLSLSWFF
jgi:hypothetical protein